MVNLKDGGRVTAKIIDLGLAKTIGESSPETAISTLGGFAGTPEFASPEQFIGIGVDIRSDLYSLGVTLWEMLTGHVLFRGSPAEVMYQHRHAALPLEKLEKVPPQVVVLLEVLLEKDPGRRFQNPAKFLEAIPAITGAIESQRRITRRELQQVLPPGSRVGTRKSPARPGPKRISVARLPITGSDVFGREEDISFLDAAWEDPQVNVVTIVAWAGVGKSTLVNHWLRRMATEQYRSASSSLAGPFKDRAPAAALRPQMNFLKPPSPGSAIRTHGSERPGRKVKDWRSLLRIAEPCWFWTAWSHSRTHLVHRKDGSVTLPSRRFYASLPPSIRGFA
jgi:serine/threonine protein kinase